MVLLNSDMNVEQLIYEVFSHRPIWCSKDPRHSDKLHIAKLWDEIGIKLNVTGTYVCILN